MFPKNVIQKSWSAKFFSVPPNSAPGLRLWEEERPMDPEWWGWAMIYYFIITHLFAYTDEKKKEWGRISVFFLVEKVQERIKVQELKNSHKKFWAWKWDFYPKSHSEILVCEIFSVPPNSAPGLRLCPLQNLRWETVHASVPHEKGHICYSYEKPLFQNKRFLHDTFLYSVRTFTRIR